MKLRKEVSLFMAKSKHVDFIAIVRSLLLVTIFAVGILLSTGCPDAIVPGCNPPDPKEYHPSAEDKYEAAMERLDAKRDKAEAERAERRDREIKAVKDGAKAEGCFTPDTKILMADGSLKNISDVVVGDILKSYNEETGGLVTTKVVKTYEFNQNHYYLINKSIKITAKHTFLTDSGWKRVCDLKVGDKIKSQGKFIEIGSIDLIAPLDIKVYNLGVDNHHSFLVSDGVDPYVVHNCGGGNGGGNGGGDGDADGEDDFKGP